MTYGTFEETTLFDIIQELVEQFDQAREVGATHFQSAVGSKFEARCRAVLAANEACEGYVLVPVVPTEAMLEAGGDFNWGPGFADGTDPDERKVWDAMIAARPQRSSNSSGNEVKE